MDTTRETGDDPSEIPNTTPIPTYRQIAGALWAGYGLGGNFLIGYTKDASGASITIERADLDDLRAALGAPEKEERVPWLARRAPQSPGVARLFEDTQHELKKLDGRISAIAERIDAIVDGRSETMRLLVDRVQKCEEQRQTNYNYFCERLNKTDETVGLNFRSNREEHNQIAVQLNGDNTEDNPGIKSQVTQLLMLVDAINTAQENLQALVEKMAPGSLKMPELPPNIATKEYVDAATHRLSAALREHIGNVIAEAVRLAAPGPGILRRILAAVRDEPTAGRKNGARNMYGGIFDPARASAAGAQAAKAASEDD
jgi:hypothetical protein